MQCPCHVLDSLISGPSDDTDSHCSADPGGDIQSQILTVLGWIRDPVTSQGWEMRLPTVSIATVHPCLTNVNFSGVCEPAPAW